MMALASAWATAQVTLAPDDVAAGSRQTLRFQVAGGCPAGQRIASVAVDLPLWFRLEQALPRAGWSLHQRATVQKNGPLGQVGAVFWSLPASASNAADDEAALEFALQGRLPPGGGALSFNVRQSCTGGHEVDARVALRVRAPAGAAVQVSHAWLRTPGAGERGSAMFMMLTASEHLRLVHAFSPAARRIEVQHTLVSKIKGMALFPDQAIDLPAGTIVRLQPGGVQLALLELSEPLGEGSTLPVTLRFEDAAGVVTEKTLTVPVQSRPPALPGGKQLGFEATPTLDGAQA